MFVFDENLFWESSIKELKNGFIYNKKQDKYICIMCGKEYKNGIIYNYNDVLTNAETAINYHITEIHKSSFNYLLNLDKKYNGLSDIQKEIAESMYHKKSDAEIASKMNDKAKSTIRNHRFVLREKYKEAKIFIAIMDLIKKNKYEKIELDFIHFHKNIPVSDGRIMTTVEEKKVILEKYFEDNFTKLTNFPKKEKEKLIVLQQISKIFENNKKYSEKIINKKLKQFFHDYVTIRRYLIEYKFMDRTDNCSEYWLKQ